MMFRMLGINKMCFMIKLTCFKKFVTLFLKRRRGVSKKSEKRKRRQDGKKKQLRKAPLSALGVLR